MKNFQQKIDFPRWNGNQRRVGLTGGIASGKSCVGNYIKKTKHIPVLDADIYAQKALRPETIATQAVIKRYGEKVTQLTIDNQRVINRKILSRIIFNNKKEREWLERLVHPLVKNLLLKDLLLTENDPTVILIIPLLFEANLTNLCSEVWVVNCSYSQQIERLIQRNNISIEEAKLQINSQISLEEKAKMADIIIDNSNKFDSWKSQINDLLRV